MDPYYQRQNVGQYSFQQYKLFVDIFEGFSRTTLRQSSDRSGMVEIDEFAVFPLLGLYS